MYNRDLSKDTTVKHQNMYCIIWLDSPFMHPPVPPPVAHLSSDAHKRRRTQREEDRERDKDRHVAANLTRQRQCHEMDIF
jgi:hypothetical protein